MVNIGYHGNFIFKTVVVFMPSKALKGRFYRKESSFHSAPPHGAHIPIKAI
jgi:hypothetical protein